MPKMIQHSPTAEALDADAVESQAFKAETKKALTWSRASFAFCRPWIVVLPTQDRVPN